MAGGEFTVIPDGRSVPSYLNSVRQTEATFPYKHPDSETDTQEESDNMDNNEELYSNLRETEMKFKKACEQVVLLNDKLEGLQRRYDKARNENHRSFRYNLRLKMATVEGVRNAYYEYACEKAERVAELRYEVSQLDRDSEDEDSEDDLDWERDGTEEGEEDEEEIDDDVDDVEGVEEEEMDAADA